jgi:predicted nucleic acid-binding protein
VSGIDSKHLYWDTCVIVRWLTGEPPQLVDHVDQFLEEAARGDRTIVVSTLVLAELRPSFLTKKAFGDIFKFFADFESAFQLIDPSPNIMATAGRLKDLEFEKTGGRRHVGTADAIHLVTCLYARDHLGLTDIVFHTFDRGKRSDGAEGKTMPMIGFESWCGRYPDHDLVKQVLALPRCEPVHPSPKMIR